MKLLQCVELTLVRVCFILIYFVCIIFALFIYLFISSTNFVRRDVTGSKNWLCQDVID